jgi:hypothetical protein
MIPDRLSDMDSIPDSLSLHTDIEAAQVAFEAALERYAQAVNTFGIACAEAAQGLRNFRKVWDDAEAAELERLANL